MHQSPTWSWNGDLYPPGSSHHANWLINPALHTARLHVWGFKGIIPYNFDKLAIPVNWGVSTIYVILTWNTISPAGSTGKADFTF